VETGSNASSVALPVVGGDENGTECLGRHVPARYKYGDVALQVEGVSNLRQLNVVMSPVGIGPGYICAGEGQQQL
jgi:hypothetical protein